MPRPAAKPTGEEEDAQLLDQARVDVQQRRRGVREVQPRGGRPLPCGGIRAVILPLRIEAVPFIAELSS